MVGGDDYSRSMVELRSLSPSRANDFMQCPMLYRFRVVDKLPEPPSLAALKGSLVHAVLEDLFALPAADRTPSAAQSMLPAAWSRLLAKDPSVDQLFSGPDERTAWLESASSLVGTYFTLEYPGGVQTEDRELFVETQLDGGLKLRGFIDRVDVAPTGETRIVDYKTGKAPPPAFGAKADFQMKFYALVVYRLRGVLPHTLQLMYLGSKDVVRYRPRIEDMRATEAKIDALWNEIRDAARSGNWRPRKSKLCDWCHHRPICPAWGGTPPDPPDVTVL